MGARGRFGSTFNELAWVVWSPPIMTTDQYKRALSDLGLFQRDIARFLGYHPDRGKKWAQHGPPPGVEKWLLYMLATRRSPDQINADIERAA